MPELEPKIKLNKSLQVYDDLLATKIGIPVIRSDLLARPQLIRRLDEAAEHELILVSTPAGFGKTTLLASWVRNSEKPVAWLSLDEEDNDPMRFWRYVVAAIDAVEAGIGMRLQPLFNYSAQATPRAVVRALVNECAALPDGLVLVLDDYHLIENQVIHESMIFLLEHLPSGIQIIISSRSDPAIPLARLRARGQMVELRAADLRFDLKETASLINKVWNLELSDDDVRILEEKTEGWVSGLQLVALSLRGSSDASHFIREFTGSNRHILDYLSEEVLEHQTEDVRSFLLETSILEQLSGSLCNALTGRSDGQEMLEQLERANLFLFPMDERRQWYRYHRLFADLLRARLQSNEPRRLKQLHYKAAVWNETHKLIGQALRHALAAEEIVWAARLVEQHVEEILQRGEGETLRGWLATLPREVVRTRPRLALAQVIAAFNSGHLTEAEPLLEQAEQAFTSVPAEAYDPSIGKEMSMLVNVPATIDLLRAAIMAMRGDAGRTIELVRRAQANLINDERAPRVSVRWNLAQADWMLGRLDAAERAFAEIVAEGRETGQPHLVLTASSVLGHILRVQGRLDAALRTYRGSLEFATRTSSNEVLSTAVAHVGMAEVFYERNQLNQALLHASKGVSLGGQLTATQTLAAGLAALAWIRQANGDSQGAREAMEQANQIIPNPEIVSLHNPVPAGRARLLLFQGNVQEAIRWVETRGLRDDDETSFARELEYLVLARILLRQNKPDRALALLERLKVAAVDQARTGCLIEIRALQALGYRATGKLDRAMETLSQALRQAEPEGYMRIFIDEGEPMAALLHAALSRGVSEAYTASLLSAFPTSGQSGQITISNSINKPLSERELEVLNLLARGASNQEIADGLTIALSTARKHVSNIIAKLGVKNRTQAVSRGRDLGLL